MNLIELLNADLALEYANGIQYMQHAACLDGLYVVYRDELLAHAKDEMKHARKLNDLITFLGGVPSANIGQIFTASENDAMLNQDLTGENTAILRYTERISQAWAQQDFATAAVLLGIIKDEQGHTNDLETILSA
jgi:bacterioferritin (cytochrome b1)